MRDVMCDVNGWMHGVDGMGTRGGDKGFSWASVICLFDWLWSSLAFLVDWLILLWGVSHTTYNGICDIWCLLLVLAASLVGVFVVSCVCG